MYFVGSILLHMFHLPCLLPPSEYTGKASGSIAVAGITDTAEGPIFSPRTTHASWHIACFHLSPHRAGIIYFAKMFRDI